MEATESIHKEGSRLTAEPKVAPNVQCGGVTNVGFEAVKAVIQ